MTQPLRRDTSLVQRSRLALILVALGAPAWSDPSSSQLTGATLSASTQAPIDDTEDQTGKDQTIEDDLTDEQKAKLDGQGATGGEGSRIEGAGTCLEGPAPRWIGVDSFTGACADPAVDCPCPQVKGWKATRAFAGAGSLPPVLSPYCLYDWAGATPVTRKAESELRKTLGESVKDLTADCAEVAPHGHPVTSTLRPWLRDQFRDAARGADPLPVGSTPPATIEIASLDSSPDSPTGDIPLGHLEHGHVVGWLGRDLTCDGATCFGFVSTWLALPHLDATTTDFVSGGSFGTRVQLAQKLVEAVTTWKARASTMPRLVMPLALGWDAGNGSPTDAASLAVHDAIVHAVCHGAFVTAAAGNATGGTGASTGTIFPAAWESELGPTASECEALEGVTTLSDLLPSYPYPIVPASHAAPLLISVAGVDYADEPIALTRPASVTRFAALAFQGVGGDPSLPLPPAHTGTSIGAMVAGAAAASVWAYDPERTAPEVLELMAATAQPLKSFEAAQCAGGACNVRRISVSAARDAVCDGPNAWSNPRCPVALPIGAGSPPPALPENPAWRLGDRTALEAYFAGEALTTATPTSSSPFQALPGVAMPAWLKPQPLQPGCSVCTFTPSNGSLEVEISESYPCAVNNVTVTVGGANYWVASTLKPGQRLRASIILAGVTGPTRGATISWVVAATGAAATEQITVF